VGDLIGFRIGSALKDVKPVNLSIDELAALTAEVKDDL
jgi:hypothetical protein